MRFENSIELGMLTPLQLLDGLDLAGARQNQTKCLIAFILIRIEGLRRNKNHVLKLEHQNDFQE